jgi:hypothetical protein
MPSSRVITYDVDPIARYRQKQLAEMNEVRNMEIRKWCSHGDLQSLGNPETVIICDIEGFEYVLLDPDKAPALKNVDILVENHHFEGRDVSIVAAEIEKRFSPTHYISKFPVAIRDRETMRSRVPKLRNLTDDQVDFALSEGRYATQVWFWMKAKNRF